MKEKRKRIPKILMDDPFKGFISSEQKKESIKAFDSFVIKRMESYNTPAIILYHSIYKSNINPIKTNEDMRTSPPKKTSLRLELEAYVVAWNTVLKDTVPSMDMVILLRNAHPAYRSAMASQAFEKGLISDRERSEFTIVSAPRQSSRTNWML